MTLGAMRCYSIGSSFVHGCKWMTDYLRRPQELLKVMAKTLGHVCDDLTPETVPLKSIPSCNERRTLSRSSALSQLVRHGGLAVHSLQVILVGLSHLL